jgi:hypothetical protein
MAGAETKLVRKLGMLCELAAWWLGCADEMQIALFW